MTPSFVANRAQLLNALTITSRAAAKRTTVAILTHLLVEADAETDDVTVTGTNLEQWVRHTFKANVKESGTTTLNADLFLKSVSALSGDTATIVPASSEFGATIKSGSAKINLSGLDPDNWNEMGEATGYDTVIPAQAFKDSLLQVMPVVGDYKNTRNLQGVNLFVQEGLLNLAATDTRCMHIREVCPVTVDDTNIVIPIEACQAINAATTDEEEMQCVIGNKTVSFTVVKGGLRTTVLTRLISEAFPNVVAYRGKQQAKSMGSVLIKREDLVGALKRASIFKTDDPQHFTLTDHGETLLFEAMQSQRGMSSEEIDVARDGEIESVARWNVQFMTQTVGVFRGEGLRFTYVPHLGGHNAIITDPDDPKFWSLCVGMEIK